MEIKKRKFIMPFPTEVSVQFSATQPQPTITFSIFGNISPTTYTVAISSNNDPNRFVLLFHGTQLDSPQPIQGPSVASVQDLDGRKIKWLIGLTSRDTTDERFRLDVICKQAGTITPNPTNAEGALSDGAELAFGFFDCSVV
jgi:hypothetical protein